MIFFHFITATVKVSGEIVRFAGKLPAKAKLCSGVTMSANTHNSTKALATVSVSFNSGDGPVVNQVLSVMQNPLTKMQPLKIHQPLEENDVVRGFAKDLGNAPAYPYTLKIYFKLND